MLTNIVIIEMALEGDCVYLKLADHHASDEKDMIRLAAALVEMLDGISSPSLLELAREASPNG